METIYRKVAVSEYDEYINYQRSNIGNDVDEKDAFDSGFECAESQFKKVDETQLQKDKEELLEMLEMIVDGTAFCNKSGRIWQHWLETIESLIQKHKQ